MGELQRLKFAHFIQGQSAETLDIHALEPLGLKYIHSLCEQLWLQCQCHEYKQGKMIVVCAGVCPDDITNTDLLVGSFTILNLELSVEDVVEAFEPISHRFVCYADQLRI